MNPTAIIAAVGAAITVATEAVKFGADVAPYAKAIWDHVINKKVVTQADLDDLATNISALRARLHAPLPPETEDDV